MQLILCKDYRELSHRAAEIIISLVKEKPNCILGLATGSTPIGTYDLISDAHLTDGLDMSQVTTFNLDEYYPIEPSEPQSYHYFMQKHLFSRVNVPADYIHIPDGTTSDPEQLGKAYDNAILEAGGIDLQLLGIGRNGHIGFNEPAETLIGGTHLTDLTRDTIHANARFFASASEVPTKAISMGMASIMGARHILLLISGQDKRAALHQLLDDSITTSCPATLLKLHPNVTVICDEAAYGD
jgi:glucosamine-6-phosphate deaminase